MAFSSYSAEGKFRDDILTQFSCYRLGKIFLCIVVWMGLIKHWISTQIETTNDLNYTEDKSITQRKYYSRTPFMLMVKLYLWAWKVEILSIVKSRFRFWLKIFHYSLSCSKKLTAYFQYCGIKGTWNLVKNSLVIRIGIAKRLMILNISLDHR